MRSVLRLCTNTGSQTVRFWVLNTELIQRLLDRSQIQIQ